VPDLRAAIVARCDELVRIADAAAAREGGATWHACYPQPRARAVRFAAQKADLAAFLEARLAELTARTPAQLDVEVTEALATILRPHGPGAVHDDDEIWVRCRGCEWAAYPCMDVRTAMKIWEHHPDYRARWLRLRTGN